MGNQDFFFANRDVPQHLVGAPLQDKVAAFVVHTSAKGKLQARSLVFKDEAGLLPVPTNSTLTAEGLPPIFPEPSCLPAMMAEGLPSILPSMHRAPATPMQRGIRNGQFMQGTVLSYNPDSTFGFIKHAAINDGDVYFKDTTGQFTEGMPVIFQLKIMPDGKPQARNLSPGFATGEKLSGTISSYSGRSGWGFIAVPNCPVEVYFKQERIINSSFGNELKGESVEFTIKVLCDGTPQALDVKLINDAWQYEEKALPMGELSPLETSGMKRTRAATEDTTDVAASSIQVQKKARTLAEDSKDDQL